MGHKTGPKDRVLRVQRWDPLVQVISWRNHGEKGEGEAADSYAQVAGGCRWSDKAQDEVRERAGSGENCG